MSQLQNCCCAPGFNLQWQLEALRWTANCAAIPKAAPVAIAITIALAGTVLLFVITAFLVNRFWYPIKDRRSRMIKSKGPPGTCHPMSPDLMFIRSSSYLYFKPGLSTLHAALDLVQPCSHLGHDFALTLSSIAADT